MNNAAALTKLTNARAGLVLDHGFFGMLALRLQLVEDNRIPTLAVDGKKIYYNAEFVLGLSMPLTKSAIAHEVMHCVFEHIGRRAQRNPRKWNMAGDYVINQVLKDSGFEIGQGWLLEPAYKDMTADHIYSLMPEDDGKGSGSGTGQPGGALCDIMDGSGEDLETQDIEWKVATVQAAEAAKAQGQLPASMRRFIEDLTAPQVNWREQLARFVTQTAKNDYSWMRPNKRFLGMGYYLPTLYSESMGEMVVCIDTSGSIDQATLNAFGGEIRAIHGSTRPEKLTVIYCDARVNHVDEFGPNDELHFDMHGGGGTDLTQSFNYVQEKGLQPECMVVLTDMYTPFGNAQDFPVMWCATTDVLAPHGETIRIKV